VEALAQVEVPLQEREQAQELDLLEAQAHQEQRQVLRLELQEEQLAQVLEVQ
jgi:hypothetical protein